MRKITVTNRLLALMTAVFLLIAISACTIRKQGTADKSGQGTPDAQQKQENKEVKADAVITLIALQTWKSSIGTVRAHGAIEITNTGDVPIKIGDISISFIGSDNSILGTETMILPVPETIMPGETAYAGDSTKIDGIDDPSEIADLEANIDFRRADKPPQILDVQDLKIIPSKYGEAKITGRVANTSQENADDIRIIIAMFDENDKLLGIYTESPDVALAPGKNMGFETSYPGIESEGFVDKVKKMVGKAYNWRFDL